MMRVEHLLPSASKALATVPQDSALVEAARRLRDGAEIVVVCDPEGRLLGVVTKSDIVARISECQGASCTAPVSAAMTKDVVCCRAKDWLTNIWTVMRERGLKNVPVVDERGRSVGVVTARDALQALLADVEHEENLLREYVACVGYR